jgi:hypothetical protein
MADDKQDPALSTINSELGRRSFVKGAGKAALARVRGGK